MPVLIVYGMPETWKNIGGERTEVLFLEPYLRDFVPGLQATVGSVLALPSDKTSVFFPVDRVNAGLGEEIVFEVKGLRAEKHAPITRRSLASAIVGQLSMFVLSYLPQCTKIEDLDGFAAWERRKEG